MSPAARRSRRGRRRKPRQSGSLVHELPVLLAVALALALFIKLFIVQAFYIPSDSMQHTLERDDRVLVSKLSTRFGDVERGEVVVFRDPGGWLDDTATDEPSNPVLRTLQRAFVFVGLLPSSDEKDLVKRVIGVGGDQVTCCDDEGRITVNGVPLDEPYVYPGDEPSEQSFDVTVPEGRLWVMGDHRSMSADSRFHRDDPGGGTIAESDVVGRAVAVAWPLDRMGGLGVPDTFDDLAAGALGPRLVAGSSPFLLGVAGAVPVVGVRRRIRRRRTRGS